MLVVVEWPVLPMKATSGTMPRGSEWVFEPKWDGHRALMRVRDGEVDVRSSTGQARTAQWPWLPAALLAALDPGALAAGDLVLDGEVIAVEADGRHSFAAVGRVDRPHALVLFDVLVVGGVDLTQRPWRDRRAELERIVTPGGPVMLTPVTPDGDALWEATRQQGFEGVVAKRTDSRYQPGRRTPSWRKVKHRREQEFVVGGYIEGEGARAATFGSLVIGCYERVGRRRVLRHAGSVGSGLDERTLRTLLPRLRSMETAECPFEPVPTIPRGRPRWVRPKLVVEVQFAEWTPDGHVRHPVFLGLRDDKRPIDVVREP